ncbi:hypothetical protein PIB30_000306 [Stylosanthes scabra]|uniref:Uncharacterized protein n=1 Tax=Stylosanthes scabra TaxID=79078 RepID=A0ABU6T2Z8_9FABA|nr:hypothetical protein [Stylosanthes scabra]
MCAQVFQDLVGGVRSGSGRKESERNESITTTLKGHYWSLCVRITWNHAYASERGRHAQLLISAPMRTHMKPPCHSGSSLTVRDSPRQHGTSAWEPGDSRSDPIRGSILRLRARGPGDSSIVPVTAGYSWELGAESRTPSNTCSKCELSPELTTRVILGILVAPCDTSFKTFPTQPARDKVLSEVQRT